MPWSEFWWIMCNDARARNDFVREVGLPALALLGLYAVLICGIIVL